MLKAFNPYVTGFNMMYSLAGHLTALRKLL
jgi:hypothetical protein